MAFHCLQEEAARVMALHGVSFPLRIGNMLETPRAALVAESIAQSADFFSFGTNDLTQLTFGFSRDDAPKFLPHYLDAHILPDDPFQTLDQEGVGEFIKMAIHRGRAGNPRLEVGVCGEVSFIVCPGGIVSAHYS